MAITLQAYALKDDINVKVTLKIIKDLNEITEKSFVLPQEKGAFISLTEELYNPSEKPTYVTKKEFKENFIDYTLNQNYELITDNQLNEKYNELFKLTHEEAVEFIEEQKEDFDSFLESSKKTYKETLEKYLTNRPVDPDDPTGDNEGEGDVDADETPEDAEDFAPQSVSDPYGWTGPSAASDPPPKMPLDTDTSNIAAQANYNPNDSVENVPPLPKTKSKRPVVDQSGLSNQSVAILNGMPPSISNNLKGIGGDRLIEPVPMPIKYPGDAFLEGENNALIQCGRDEIYRLKGHTAAGAVYVVAGRSPTNIKTEDKENINLDSSQNIALKKPNNLVRDAAYLYVSQKSDSETLLRVAGGTYAKKVGGVNPRAGLSLAAMKADDVVIMARESGIRLITGMDNTNSRGGELSAKFGIDLIAGNDDSDLQPLVKGDNLELYLTTLSEVVDNIRSVLYNFITSQLELNASIASHTHYDPFSIFLGTMATGNPLQINGGQNYLSPDLLNAGTKAMMSNAQQQANTISGVLLKRINNDFNAFNPLGAYKIKSPKNKTN